MAENDPAPTDPPAGPAKDDPPADPPADPKTTGDPGDGYPDDLGDAGKKALDRERKARREAEARAKELEPLAAKARELEDAQKTEQQKLAEQLEAARADGSKATTELTRLDVALDKAPDGMPVSEIRKLAKRLTGATREELEADAEELFELFQAAEREEPMLPARPRPRLRGGGDPTEEPEETDPRKLAERLPRY